MLRLSYDGEAMLISRAREFYELTGTLRENRFAGYAFALSTIALALLARFLIAGQIGGFPFLTFIPAILLTSFICGWRAGALAAVLGAIARWYFFLPLPAQPATTLESAAGTPSLIGFSMYAFAVVVILALVGAMHLAFRDFAASEEQRKQLNAKLEMRVRERTEELEAANQRLRDEAASRVAAEAQIRQLQKMEAVGQLTGGIAHDFNNMLAIVVGSLDIAKRHLMSDRSKAERFISNAMEGAQRGAQLTSRLLAFSRQQPLEPRPLDVNALVHDMSDLLRRSIGENIRLDTVLTADLWRTFADASQLESAVINLCVNSRDAMPEGGKLTLETANAALDAAYAASNVDARAGDYVVIAVTDTGTGMTPEVLATGVRSVLHDQEHGQRHRIGPFAGIRLRQTIGRPRQDRLDRSARVRRFASIYRATAGPTSRRPRSRANRNRRAATKSSSWWSKTKSGCAT